MHLHRSLLRLAATIGTIVFLVSGLFAAPPARAEDAPAGATVPTTVTAEATIDATGVSDGLIRVKVTGHGLAGGQLRWTRPDGGATAAANIALVGANGIPAVVAADGTAVVAYIAAGDWTLSYELPVVAPSAGAAVLIAPSECLLLPPDALVSVDLLAPPGWVVTGNMPIESQNTDGFRLGTARFLLTPEAPRIIARVGSQPAEVAVVALDAEAVCPEEWATTLGHVSDAFQAVAGLSEQVPACVFVRSDSTLDDIAGQLLDVLWAIRGMRAPGDAGAMAQSLVDSSLWPLLRGALLTDSGFPIDAALARRICDEHRLFGEAQPPAPPALTAASLSSLYFVARELPGGARQLYGAFSLVCQPASEGNGGDFVDRLAAALAGDGSANGVTASGLLLRLAGRTGEASVALPDLPDKILAIGDPDRDGDGLPDRVDPAPDEPGIAIIIGGRPIRFDVAPLNVSGRIMVPLRFLAQHLGLTVAWDSVSRVASVSRTGYEAQFPVGTHYYLAGGLTHYLDAPTTIEGGRTLVSLRFVAKALDVSVVWDGAARTVTVLPEQPYSEEPVQPVEGRMAYLTFDDGPEPGMTPKILAVLKTYSVHATFFVLGGVASGQGELLRRILAEGNGLGNHSYSHTTSPKSEYFLYRSPEAYLAELAACDRVIAAATGTHPRASRPPGGSYPYVTEEFRKLLRANGYLSYDWDVSAADSALPRPTTEQVLTNIMAGARDGARRRPIILMHDGGREHQTTLAALPAVIEYLRACGYSFGILPGAGLASPATP